MLMMRRTASVFGIVALLAAAPASAESLRSDVGFNNSIGQKTADQPTNGVKVAYRITLKGGDLNGCTVDIVESLYGRDEGSWGIFDIAGQVACSGGGFAYTSSGAWDGNGFHAAGAIDDGSGTGSYQGIGGRIAQLGGGASAAADGTYDISYQLVIDEAGN